MALELGIGNCDCAIGSRMFQGLHSPLENNCALLKFLEVVAYLHTILLIPRLTLADYAIPRVLHIESRHLSRLCINRQGHIESVVIPLGRRRAEEKFFGLWDEFHMDDVDGWLCCGSDTERSLPQVVVLRQIIDPGGYSRPSSLDRFECTSMQVAGSLSKLECTAAHSYVEDNLNVVHCAVSVLDNALSSFSFLPV